MITSGSIVELIDDVWKPSKYGETFPVKGLCYTVRAVLITESGIGLWLEEIVNRKHRYKGGITEIMFSITRFREVHLTAESIINVDQSEKIFLNQ